MELLQGGGQHQNSGISDIKVCNFGQARRFEERLKDVLETHI